MPTPNARDFRMLPSVPLMLALMIAVMLALGQALAAADPADIYIFAGQSNMFGTGQSKSSVPASLAAADPNVTILKMAPTTAWVPLQNGVNNNDATDAWGSEAELSARLAAAPGAKAVHIIKFAAPGSWLAPRPDYDWNPSSHELLDSLLRQIEAAKKLVAAQNQEAHFRALIWMQGESDCNDQAAANDYQKNLEALIAAVRGATGDAAMPVYLDRVHRHYAGAFLQTVRAAEARAAATGSHITMIDTDDCPLGPDSIHFNATGHVQIGDAYADLMLGKVHQTPCVIADGQHFSVRTHAGPGTKIGTVALAQAGSPTPVFTLIGDNAAAFAIDHLTGVITVADAAALTAATDVTVEAANGVAPLNHAAVHIDITPTKPGEISGLLAAFDPTSTATCTVTTGAYGELRDAHDATFHLNAPGPGAQPAADVFPGTISTAMAFNGHTILIGPNASTLANPGVDEDLTIAVAVALPATAPDKAPHSWLVTLNKDAAQPVFGIFCDPVKGGFGLLCSNAFNGAPLGADAKPAGPGGHALRLRKVGASCRLYIDGALAAEATTPVRRLILNSGEGGTFAIGGSFAPAPSFVGLVGRILIVKGIPTTDEEAAIDQAVMKSAGITAKP